MPSKDDVIEMVWYWRDPHGQRRTIVHCESQSCALLGCNSTCPKFRSKLKIKGMTLVLLNVREEDCGLQLHCQILPKWEINYMDGTFIVPDPQVYTINISAVLPGQSITKWFCVALI